MNKKGECSSSIRERVIKQERYKLSVIKIATAFMPTHK
jgi:hypothetical protein